MMYKFYRIFFSVNFVLSKFTRKRNLKLPTEITFAYLNFKGRIIDTT